jgi:predicted nicotinamide N-methyase
VRIEDQTRIARPPLCPEIALHLVTEACPWWRIGEAELAALGIGEPFWAFAWPGGQALARYLLDHPRAVAGRRLLDFGAGSGLVAIAAAISGAVVTAAEIDPIAGQAIAMNAALNGVRVEVVIGDRIGSQGRWDLIAAADMCYERALAGRVLAWLRAEAARGVEVWIADPDRGFLDRAALIELARLDAPADVDLLGAARRSTAIYRLA